MNRQSGKRRFGLTIYAIATAFILCILTACQIFPSRSNKFFIVDEDYYEIKRQYSPDKTKLLLTYGHNQGATGQGEVGTAILQIADTSKDLRPFTIPWYEYNNHMWLNNDTAVFYLDYLKKMRQSDSMKTGYDTVINGIRIKYDYKDLVDSSYQKQMPFNQFSSNNQYRLSVYRYVRDSLRNNFLNISVTKANDSVPRYGNFFIGVIKDDYIYYCKWSDANELFLYTTSSCQYILENYFVQNRINVPVVIKVKDDVPMPFIWSEKNKY